MNKLFVGFDKQPLLYDLPQRFLFIDDGELIDKLDLPPRRSVTHLDLAEHSFNPLKGMDYRKARAFIDVLDASFPEGAATLTRRGSNFVLLKALLAKPRRLDRLLTDSKDPHERDAFQKIQTLLLSPVLERVLNRPTNLSFKGTLIARLDRAAIGDFDAFVLGNLLMAEFRGAVTVPDFGFYASPSHLTLVRQGRLTAGVNFLDELPEKLRQAFLANAHIEGSGTTHTDAELLAIYEGYVPGTNAHNDFVRELISRRVK